MLNVFPRKLILLCMLIIHKYGGKKISKDHTILQSDIDKIFAWSNRNKMKFNPFESEVHHKSAERILPFTIYSSID